MEGLHTQIPGYVVRVSTVDGFDLPLGSLYIFSSDCSTIMSRFEQLPLTLDV